MKKISSITLSLVFALTLSGTALAAETVADITLPNSSAYTLVRAKEWIRINLLTFKASSKASLYNGYSDRRVSEMSYASSLGDTESIEKSLNRYEIQKERAMSYAQRAMNSEVLSGIKQMTLAQQRTMTNLQLQLSNSGELQNNIVRVQKEIALRAKEVVENIEGQDEADTIDKQTWVIWSDPNAEIDGELPDVPATLEYAPGTGPGGVGTRVYEGGSKHIWAPGTTSAGGPSSATTSQNVIETDGSSGSDSSNSSSGTVIENSTNGNGNENSGGQAGNTVQSGSGNTNR